MPKVTDELLKTHLVVRRLLEEARADNPRFPQALQVLRRAVAGHVWFEERIFYPALRDRPGHDGDLMGRLSKEHERLEELLQAAASIPVDRPAEVEKAMAGLRAALDDHLTAEKQMLYPSAEKVLDLRAQEKLSAEMESRKSEVRDLVFPSVNPTYPSTRRG
jgi:iron-sulfur cluster repair protein YtfE (RIC family)